MINFKEEILKYEPMLEIDGIERAINNSEMQDMLDMLNHILRQKTAGGAVDQEPGNTAYNVKE